MTNNLDPNAFQRDFFQIIVSRLATKVCGGDELMFGPASRNINGVSIPPIFYTLEAFRSEQHGEEKGVFF